MSEREAPVATRGTRAGAEGLGRRLSVRGGTPLYDALKRAMDLVLASALLVVVFPLYPLVALAIVLDSPGPVIFRQQRIGRGGRPFRLLKLRSMVADADPALHRRYVQSLMTPAVSIESSAPKALFKINDDPRITRVGRILRTTSLDELPQLINVLRGEMTLVGPRPDLPYAVRVYEPWQRERLEVLPGITGLWQVSGRSRLSPLEMMELDIRYVRERSLWLDVAILIRTVPRILRMRDSA